MEAKTIDSDLTVGGSQSSLLASRYRVVRQLGQGGMGSVWLAEDTQLDNRQVAVKMLPSILVANRRAYNQLKSEALVSLKLTHPNIATVRAFEENNGNPFLVVDYIDGKTLDDYLADNGKLGEDETIRLLEPIASALDYAHGEGVCHRDVKPSNVMIRRDGHPFVLDFGIAREIQETLTRVTGKLSSGTLMYMSPEQLNGDAPSAAQDVYSFAAMTYECLTGAPPFSRGNIEFQILNKRPESIASHFRKCGPGIMAGLSKLSADRPTDCVHILTSHMEGTPTETTDTVSATLNPVLNTSSGPRVFHGSRRWPLLALCIAAVALGAAALFWQRFSTAEAMREKQLREIEAQRMADEKMDAAKRQEEKSKRDAEAKRLVEQLEQERAAREKAEAERQKAEAALRSHTNAVVRADDDKAASAARRKELADLAHARTLIDIKRDRGSELRRMVEIYRDEKEGFEKHLAAFDAEYEKLKSIVAPDTSADSKRACDTATHAVDSMALELKWLADNRKGRDTAKQLEAEISTSLDAELVRFKASEVATGEYKNGTELRQRGNVALANGDFTLATQELTAAMKKLSTALVEAKRFHVSLALAAAKQRMEAEQWEKCFAECEKALRIDSQNETALSMREKISKYLGSSVVVEAGLKGKKITGASVEYLFKKYSTPAKIIGLRTGDVISLIVTHEINGVKYSGVLETTVVDWNGCTNLVVELERR